MVIQIQDRVAIADNAITAPKKKEPVSPINTFALCQLNSKKIIYAPITIISNIATAKFPYFIAYPIKNVKITIPTLDESPSTPSVKFTAFEKPVIQMIVKIANNTKLCTSPINGI